MPVFKPFKTKDNRSSTSIGGSTNHSPQSQTEQSILAGTTAQGGYRPTNDQRRPQTVSRSPSQRNFPQNSDRPPVDVARAVHNYSAEEPPPPDQQLQHQHQQQQQQQYTPYNQQQIPQQVENGILAPVEEPRTRLRDKLNPLKLGHSSNRESVDRTSKSAGLSRSQSTKRKDVPQNLQQQQQQQNYVGSTEEQYRQQWSQRQSSNLQVTHEGDENNIDPFQQIPHEGAHREGQPSNQGYAPYIQQQDHYPAPPPLHRVDTDQSSGHQPTGNEPYSPTEQNPAYQPLQYQVSPDPNQQIHPNQQQQYQAFQPSPLAPSTPQLDSGEYPNQFYQQNQLHQSGFTGSQYLQPGPPPVHLQQHHYSDSTDLHHHVQSPAQFSEQDAHTQHLQQQQQSQQQAPPNLHLQPGRPSSQQGLASPTQLTQPPQQYQAYGSPPPNQQHPLPGPPPPQGGHPQTQDGSFMPLQKQPRGQDKQHQAGPPPRESSLNVQPGQPPLVSPGIASFPASVVPQASQGQPFNKGVSPQPQEGDLGRDTPTPRSATDSMGEDEGKAFAQLQEEHRTLKEKYNKVKKHYFDKEAQVHTLQNTIAHHRLSQSRTSLDDTEYFQRFDRLQGFIKELAYNIRKEWKTIPAWLHGSVNKEAIETGKQEMTAVGRAFLTRWLMEEVFDKHFHPDLDTNLSQQLRRVQNNIRRFSPIPQSKEDDEQLSAKITSWRLATLDGLQDILKSPQAAENRKTLITLLQKSLIADMQKHLIEPPPPELDGGVHMIIELVIERIAAHIPLESRDIVIEYFPPGHTIINDSMKVESACPALTNPIAGDAAGDAAERASLKSTASDLGKDGASVSSVDDLKDPDKARNRGLLTGVFGAPKKPPTGQPIQGRQGDGSQVSLTQPPGSSAGPKEDGPPGRVRMAACMGVRIRGRPGVLYKAPVFAV